MTKYCTGCASYKPKEEFSTNGKYNGKPQRRSQCRKCRALKCKEWLKRHPGYKAKWRRDNPALERAYQRKRQLKYEYGLNQEEYDQMFLAQGGKCAICRKTSKHTLQVDHDHETKTIRGLLCKACNRGLGMFKDSLLLLRLATEYLSLFREF